MAEDISARVAWALKKALTPKDAAAPSGRGTATFVRRDESGVGWVRIPGNDFDTPVAGGIVAEAQPGDTVTYNIENNGVTITGNSTSPSVGGRFVGEALAPVRKALSGLGGRVAASLNIAEAAQAVASAINQHFWTDTSGIHVTEATQEDWNTNHSGANVLINALGQLFRDGLNNLLTLTTEDGARVLTIWDGLGNAAENVRAIIGETIQLGKADESHLDMNYHSLKLVDKEQDTYFYVSDLRDSSGYATLVESGTLINVDWFGVSMPIASVDYVEVDGVTLDPSEYDVGNSIITFHEDQPEGSLFEVSYKTDSSNVKAYTLGIRLSGSHVGALSHAEGYDVEASGALSHAEGHRTVASGYVSHAEGNISKASGSHSHAEGMNTIANGSNSHAEGNSTTASGFASHAEGTNTVASGNHSHAQNCGTRATGKSQTVIGEFNEIDTAGGVSTRGRYAFIIGNGSDADNRSNAFAVDWNGNVTANGQVSYADPYNSGSRQQLGDPTRYEDSGSYAITTAGIDSLKNGPHITIPAGSYMFVGAWTFNSASASGDRNMQVGFRSGASGTLWGERVRIRQSSGNFAILNVSALRVFTSETTVYLAGSASITSGKGSCYITAIRLN